MILVLAVLLLAHSWYPFECCGDGDCKELAGERVKLQGDNYLVRAYDGTITVPIVNARPSPDEHYHICAYKSATTWVVRCFFAPRGSV